MEQNSKLYLLINNSLSVGLTVAQAVHGGVQWVLDNHPHQTWNNGTLVCLACPNIDEWKQKLEFLNVNFSTFHEPDIDNQLTASIVYGHEKLFRKLKLIGK